MAAGGCVLQYRLIIRRTRLVTNDPGQVTLLLHDTYNLRPSVGTGDTKRNTGQLRRPKFKVFLQKIFNHFPTCQMFVTK